MCNMHEDFLRENLNTVVNGQQCQSWSQKNDCQTAIFSFTG